MEYFLNSNDDLSLLAKSNGITTWNELTNFIKKLPYGRNKNRFDFGLVLSEKKGACSSKHALLKKLADLNQIPNVSLILGMYRMTEKNTPKIGKTLTSNSIDFMPEAHCYLRIEGERVDFTSEYSNFNKIKADLIQEIEIEPEQVAQFKVDYHKDFIRSWIKRSNSQYNFNQLWEIREACIRTLSQ